MAAAVKIVYSIKDNKGKISRCEVKVPTGLTLAQYSEFAVDMGTLIDAITNGQIVNVGIAFTVDISSAGYTAAPGSTSDVEEKGQFMFNAGLWKTVVNVPCISDTDVISGSDLLDTTDVDIAAFISGMTAGLTLVDLTVVQPCDERETDISSLEYARERFVAS